MVTFIITVYFMIVLSIIAYHWVMTDMEYRSYGLPWYKRPAAFWYGLITICTIALLSQ